MKIRGDAHGATRSFAASIKLKIPGSCHLFVLTSFSHGDLEFESQTMGPTALIFLLIAVGITLPLIFFLIPRYSQDSRESHRPVYYLFLLYKRCLTRMNV
jgi:hypothetical protein